MYVKSEKLFGRDKSEGKRLADSAKQFFHLPLFTEIKKRPVAVLGGTRPVDPD
jgi:hypothetical protein